MVVGFGCVVLPVMCMVCVDYDPIHVPVHAPAMSMLCLCLFVGLCYLVCDAVFVLCAAVVCVL